MNMNLGDKTMTNENVEYCEYGNCDRVASEICDTCGALLCDKHVIVGNVDPTTGIHYTYCRKFACIPYIMGNK